MRIPGRAEDDLVLVALAMRQRGVSAREIARELGFASPEAVRTATNRVRDADLAESGEDPALVAAAYSPALTVSRGSK